MLLGVGPVKMKELTVSLTSRMSFQSARSLRSGLRRIAGRRPFGLVQNSSFDGRAC
jgi:hypothetical protein